MYSFIFSPERPKSKQANYSIKKVSNQISWKIFLSDYHVFTSRFAVKERKKAQKLCVNAYIATKWAVGVGECRGVWEEEKREKTTIPSQLKRGKLSLYIFLIFCGGKKEKIKYIETLCMKSFRLLLFSKKSERKERERAKNFHIKCACVYVWVRKSLCYWKEGCQNMSVYVKPYLRDYYFIPLYVVNVWCEKGTFAKWYLVTEYSWTFVCLRSMKFLDPIKLPLLHHLCIIFST